MRVCPAHTGNGRGLRIAASVVGCLLFMPGQKFIAAMVPEITNKNSENARSYPFPQICSHTL